MERSVSDVAEKGLQVFWYPRGVFSDNPCIGFIRCVHPQDKVDIIVLPDDDGACTTIMHVPHINSLAARDHTGGVHPHAMRNGVWDFTPMAIDYIERKHPKKPEVVALEVDVPVVESEVQPSQESRRIRREVPGKTQERTEAVA